VDEVDYATDVPIAEKAGKVRKIIFLLFWRSLDRQKFRHKSGCGGDCAPKAR
jgi:hypothetical protein